MTWSELQTWLKERQWYTGKIDGDPGPLTLAALELLRRDYRALSPLGPPSPRVVPADWMPNLRMDRVIVHWTAGAYQANGVDRRHYHILVEGDGDLVRGYPSIALNPASGVLAGYAAHTSKANSGSIGVSMCCMQGAKESPFDAGAYPMTAEQWHKMILVVRDLCDHYKIPVGVRTVLTHAEVQATLGIKQAGKWDVTRLAFDPTIVGAAAIGDKLRAAVVSL